ncbi:MAG: tetratricopeptide repeat protein, partial [Devosia sp.]
MPGWKALRNGPAARTGPTSAADPLLPTLRRALEAHRRGEFRQAALLYQQILAVNANHPEAIHGLGMALFQLGQPESAEPRLRRAIELAPKSSVFHGNLGAVLLALDRPAEALESYRKALRLEPEIAPLHAGLAAALLTLGREEESAQSARRALRLKPDLALGHAQLGRALAAANRTAEGLASLDRALALDPAFVEAHIWRADVLHRLGDAEAALAGYRAAARLKPGHAAAHLGIAQTLLALGRFEGAADNFRAAIYTRPSATAYAGLARALRALGQAEAAVEPFDMAHRLAPADAAVAEERVALYAELGRDLQPDAAAPAKLTRLEEEEARARMAVKVTPGNHVALGNLGNTLVGLGRLHEAREVYRQALAAKPDYFWVWSELIFLMNYLGDVPVEEMVAGARRYGAMVSSRHPPRLVHDNDRDPDRRLRVGFISADLYGHPVARFLEGVLGELDREALEPVVYDT